jgi:hypothetical protein
VQKITPGSVFRAVLDRIERQRILRTVLASNRSTPRARRRRS